MTRRCCIILWDRVFERYEWFNEYGCSGRFAGTEDFEAAQRKVKEWGYQEVSINSKIGRRILNQIGQQR